MLPLYRCAFNTHAFTEIKTLASRQSFFLFFASINDICVLLLLLLFIISKYRQHNELSTAI